MILIDFLSRQLHEDSNPHVIIPISFNIQGILQSRYYNLGKENLGKYLVQTRSQTKSSSIRLPEVHGIEKGLDLNIPPEKQVIKPIVAVERKETSQIKQRLGQGREGLRQKIKTPVPHPISKSIVKLMEKQIEQTKVLVKVLIQENSRIHDKILPISDYAIPHTKSSDDSSSRMAKRKTIPDISTEIPMYPDPTYRPLPKPVKLTYTRSS